MTRTETRGQALKKQDPLPVGLPLALRPWAQAFAGMPEAHLLVIGRLMAALAPLIDSQDTALNAGFDELDSFDDVAAIGPLERLMTSELMWLKLMRSEFVRRVAEGEALRRRPVYRDPAEDRAVAVLIDNGQRMLGRRRLVALAALLILGSSALRRGDRFLWASTNHIGPAWQEGISRRTLSRYINQTGVAGLDSDTVSALLQQAQFDPDDNRTVVWAIAPKGMDAGDWTPHYRIEVDEHWPDTLTAEAVSDNAFSADVAVTSRHGIRRTARFPFPDEQVSADTLRSPFRKVGGWNAHVNGGTWAPDWISREADDGAAILRDADGIVLFRRNIEPLRFDLANQDALLGARWPGNGPGALVVRDGDEIHAIRFSQSGYVFGRGSTTLAADHPLIAGFHSQSAVPPLLRLGRKSNYTVAAPNGQLYALSILGDDTHSGLSVELSEQSKDLRLLLRSRSWLLCDTERGGHRAFVLLHVRTGRRIFLRRDPALDEAKQFSGFEVIGETGGALVQVDGTWRWIAPAWWSQDQYTTELPVPGSAFLLRVDPLQHARNGVLTSQADSYPLDGRRWNAVFWSQEDGPQEWLFAYGKWTHFRRQSPTIEGRVVAMVLIGKNVLARVQDEDDVARLFEFRLDSLNAPRVQAGPRWWEGATCVEY